MRTLIALTLGLFLCMNVAGAVTIDLGSYSLLDPLILANYTNPVAIFSVELTALDFEEEYTITQTPASTEYAIQHQLRPDKPLLPGRYQLALMARDQQARPTDPDPIDFVEFQMLGLDIILVDPPLGFATGSPFDIVFKTQDEGFDIDAVCRWNLIESYNFGIENSAPTDEGDTPTSLHTISGFDKRGVLTIICREPSGRETPATFTVGWDDTPPTIQTSANPSLVTDPLYKWSVIRVLTDDNTTCRIDGELFLGEDPLDMETYTDFHEYIVFYNDITDQDRHEFSYEVECTNLVGFVASDTVNVTVDFGFQPADHCLNGVLDGDEEQVDCGGSCHACVTCFVDEDCPGADICDAGVCVPPSGTCGNGIIEPGESCDGFSLSGLACSDFGFSGGVLSCTAGCNLDTSACTGGPTGVCGDNVINVNESCDGTDKAGLSCSDFGFLSGTLSCANCDIVTSACVPGEGIVCVSDIECPDFTYTCESGFCVKKAGPECRIDSDCPSFDDRCFSGECVPRDGDNEPPLPPGPEEEKTDWLAIILMILGLLIMGGAGYFLYMQNEEKKHAQAQQKAQQTTGPIQERQVDEDTKRRMAAQAAAKKAAREQAQKEKEAQRKKVFSKFDDGDTDKKKKPKEKPKEKSKEKPKEKQKEDDVFDKLEDLGK